MVGETKKPKQDPDLNQYKNLKKNVEGLEIHWMRGWSICQSSPVTACQFWGLRGRRCNVPLMCQFLRDCASKPISTLSHFRQRTCEKDWQLSSTSVHRYSMTSEGSLAHLSVEL